MHYIPPKKYFIPQEFFSPSVIEMPRHSDNKGNIHPRIWRLMDSRVLWTAVQLRKRYGTMIVNDYLWGGDNFNRGYRHSIDLIDTLHWHETGEIIAEWSSFTSQHCFGRAVDSSFKNILVEEVRQDIIKNIESDAFKFITAIEKDVSWLHYDCRNHNGVSRLILF